MKDFGFGCICQKLTFMNTAGMKVIQPVEHEVIFACYEQNRDAHFITIDEKTRLPLYAGYYWPAKEVYAP